MNTIKRIIVIVVLPLLLTTVSLAQQTQIKKIAVLPFTYNGVDSVFVQTADAMLRLEISRLDSFNLIQQKLTSEVLLNNDCIFSDNDCAVKIGNELGAEQVLTGNLSALGDKIIVQYFLIDVLTSEDIIIDQITAANVEDLEVVMKRIAKSINEKKSINQDVEVGQVTETETKNSLRRGSNKNIVVSFGYLYPSNGYDDIDNSLVFDLRYGFELDEAALGLMLGIRSGFAMNIYGQYLFTKTDFCPYLGGALGFHWVSHDLFGDKADGFELSLNTGIRAFRTYSFEILINFEYIITFNKFNDRAFVFTVGIL